MAEEGKRVRRSRSAVIQEKLEKAKADKEKYTAKIAELDETIKTLEEELNSSRSEEVMTAIANSSYSVDQVLEMLKK